MNICCSHTRLVPLAELDAKRHPKNPNTHSAAQIAAIAAVLQANGVRAPIVVSNRSGLMTRGHGRLEAAQLLGLESFPVDFQDYDSEEAEIADMIADNRLSELAELDEVKLTAVLKDLAAAGHAIDATGFTEEEFARLTEIAAEEPQLETIPQMELQAFEHYDYLCFMFHDLRDWMRVVQVLGVSKVNFSISRKTQKIGIGRVINGKALLRRLEPETRHPEPQPPAQGGDAPVGPERDPGGS